VGNPIRILLETLLELFYPSNCVGCGHPQDSGILLCTQCKETSPRLRAPFCRCCSRPFDGLIAEEFSCPNCEDRRPAFDCAVSNYQAKGVLRDLIHRFKYDRQFYLRRVLAEYLLEAMQDVRIQANPADCLVPVPLTRRDCESAGSTRPRSSPKYSRNGHGCQSCAVLNVGATPTLKRGLIAWNECRTCATHSPCARVAMCAENTWYYWTMC
jgi:hypothetical protein